MWDAENWPGLVSFFSREIDATRASDVKKPRYSYCLFQRGAAYLSMDPPNYALAKRDVKTTLDLDPDCPNAHTSMADILLHEDTTASCQQAVVHATKALASRHPLGEWKKGSVRFLALQARADARFELLDETKLGYDDELSDHAEQDLKTLVDKKSKWKDYKPDDEAITDLEEKLADVRAEAKRRKASARPVAPTSSSSAAAAVGGGGEGSGKGKKRSAPSPPTDKQQQPDASKPPAGKRVGREARRWTREDVAEWLPSIGAAYRQYKTVFVDNGVDGKVLLGIIGGDNEERANVEMEETLKVKSAIHREALISAARKLREAE